MNKLPRSFLAIIALFTFFTLVGASSAKKGTPKRKPLALASIHLVDRNGFSETISSKDRVRQYQNVDFLKPQPYQKALSVYERDSQGTIRSIATTYYENGHPKQFLEIVDGRAKGTYTEWHENGQPSSVAYVVGGIPDLTPAAEKSWIFHGPSYAWDESGLQIAQIYYQQGQICGTSSYFHSNGQIWKSVPFEKGEIHGRVDVYKQDGELLSQTNYCHGEKEGRSIRFWDGGKIASDEIYHKNGVLEGKYYNRDEQLVAEVREGNGFRAIFGASQIRKLQEIHNGFTDGEVKVFEPSGWVSNLYHIKNGIKHGEEIVYYSQSQARAPQQPELSFYWVEGAVHGTAKTWYPNGNLRSQKEFANSKLNGLNTAWYEDGNLMMIEEYEDKRLIRGEYYKKGERIPTSQVIQGKGIATIYSPEGKLMQKINYFNGRPEEQ